MKDESNDMIYCTERLRHRRIAMTGAPWLFRIVLLMSFISLFNTAVSHSQQDSVSYAELQKKFMSLGYEIDSLRSLLGTHGTTLFYLNQSDSAGLWDNPYVQRQIDKEMEFAHAQFTTRTTNLLIGMIAFGFGVLLMLLLFRYQLSKRISRLENGIETLTQTIANDSTLKSMSTLEQHEKQLHAFNESNHPGYSGSFDDVIGIDHSLPLRVADEIHRMRKRIQYMPEDSQAAKALTNSLKRLEEELNQGGYEVVALLGKKYVDGLNVEARFVPAEDASIDGEIITEIVRPQVNYMGVMIQQAKVEVSKSYS